MSTLLNVVCPLRHFIKLRHAGSFSYTYPSCGSLDGFTGLELTYIFIHSVIDVTPMCDMTAIKQMKGHMDLGASSKSQNFRHLKITRYML